MLIRDVYERNLRAKEEATAATSTTDTETNLTEQVPEHLKVPDKIPAHISLDGTPKLAPLEHYIVLAEQRYLPKYARNRIFRRVPGVQPPTLRSDRDNRVLVFPGSFNPPHLGHTGLLWHTYLSFDDKTIAAMILPMRTSSVSRKKLTAANWRDERTFRLTSFQRAQLWNDEVLSRFVWVWPSSECEGSCIFLRCVSKLAWEDGFKIDFPSLHGGDHMRTFRRDGEMGWGLGSIVTSDVGRPVDFVKGRYEGIRLPHCKKWKGMKTGTCGHESDKTTCPQCWPCQKLEVVYPEFFQRGLIKPAMTFSGDIAMILQQCHDSYATIWWAKKPSLWSVRPDYVVFVPADRTYGAVATKAGTKDEAYQEIETAASSTSIRRLYFCYEDRADFRRSLESLVVNPELLAIYLGMDDRWSPLDDRSGQQREGAQVVDDLAVGMEAKKSLSTRRGSF